MRDPKIDPQPGDQVRGKSGTVRTVVRIDGPKMPNPKVMYTAERNGVTYSTRGTWLQYWRLWCERNAV